MSSTRQRRDWEDLSTLDPYWAILSDPSRRFGGWDREELVASGTEVVERVLGEGMRFEAPAGHSDALDFGCGVGRLTHALAPHFERCLGVDISNRMIAEAREVTADSDNCAFDVTNGRDLAHFADTSFDLVLSMIVLQHIPSRTAKRKYISEFVRVLRPRGLLAFQLPSRIPLRHRAQPRSRVYAMLRNAGVRAETLYRTLRLDPMRMTSMPERAVRGHIEAAGGRVLQVRHSISEGGVISAEYLATKEPTSSPPSR